MRLMTLALAGFFLLFAAPADAGDKAHGDHAGHDGLAIKEVWARASAGPARAGAVYVKIENPGTQGDRLVGGATERARTVQVHRHVITDGIARMRPVDGVDLPVGGSVILKPGGDHLMLLGLKKPLKQGETFPMTLKFEKAGAVKVNVKVEAVAAKGTGGDHSHHGAHGGHGGDHHGGDHKGAHGGGHGGDHKGDHGHKKHGEHDHGKGHGHGKHGG